MKESVRAARDEIAHNRSVAALKQLAGENNDKIKELENLRLHNVPPTIMGATLEREVMADILEDLASGSASGYPSEPLEESTVQLLSDAGYDTLEKVREASDEDLLAIDDIGDATLQKIRGALGTHERPEDAETPEHSDQPPDDEPPVLATVLDEGLVETLRKNNYLDAKQVVAASDEDLLAIKGIGDAKLAEIREKVG